jgi:hypothetical protein
MSQHKDAADHRLAFGTRHVVPERKTLRDPSGLHHCQPEQVSHGNAYGCHQIKVSSKRK